MADGPVEWLNNSTLIVRGGYLPGLHVATVGRPDLVELPAPAGPPTPTSRPYPSWADHRPWRGWGGTRLGGTRRGGVERTGRTWRTVGHMFDMRWDAGLDDAQLAAATHGDGPLIVLAGAGTGKTRTLVVPGRRAGRPRGRPGADPAADLHPPGRRRDAGPARPRSATGATRPASCGAAPSTRSPTGWSRPTPRRWACRPALSVLDPGDARDLMDLLRHDHGLTGGGQRFPRGETLLDIYSRAVNTGRPARDVITEPVPLVRAAHRPRSWTCSAAYVARKRAQSLLDFDDLLLGWRALLADPALGPAMAGRWDHVLVDEYQDVNQIQVDIVPGCCPDGRRADRGRRRRPGRLRVPRRRQPAPARPGRRPAGRPDRRAWSGTSGPGNGSSTWPTRSARSPAATGCSCAPTATAAAGPGWSAATTRRPRPGWSSTPSSTRPSRAGRCATRRC